MAAESKKDEMNKKKLHGDSSTAEHNNSNMVPSKGGRSSPPSDARSCVSSLRDVSGSFKEGDVDHEYQFTDQNTNSYIHTSSLFGLDN
ncbi:YTH domain-containing protein [Trifolium repens]|nr:YTH domain-containing protein [Trifolium repens]